MPDLIIAHMTQRSQGKQLYKQYQIIDRYLNEHFGKNIIINEVSIKEKELENKLKECEALLKRFVPDESTIQWENREIEARDYFLKYKR